MAFSNGQLRGAILEEAILSLLYSSGYDPVFSPGTDPSLELGGAGLKVRGRGEWHQVDAIADFALPQPFVNPQRLLVEAKFISERVGIDVARNALGVLKDVSEYWVGNTGSLNTAVKSRYHYQFAVFSATEFSKPTQNFAYAHDIHLLPLANSAFFEPVVSAIASVSVSDFRAPVPKLHTIRQYTRNRLFEQFDLQLPWTPEMDRAWPMSLQSVIDACRTLSFGFIAMLGNRMPVFLVANPELSDFDQLDVSNIRIRWLEGSWFIEGGNDRRLFSFDLPKGVAEQYTSIGRLDRRAVANIKQDLMRHFYAYRRIEEGISVKRFVLDEPWFEEVERELGDG